VTTNLTKIDKKSFVDFKVEEFEEGLKKNKNILVDFKNEN
jgi:hypothetical protein